MATPVFCVLVDEEVTCPVCLELLRDPSSPQLLNFPHVCCTLCIQKMRVSCNTIIDCPDCCHIARVKAEKLNGTAQNAIVRGAKQGLSNIETCYFHTDSPDYRQIMIEDIQDNGRQSKTGESYCVVVEEDLPCPVCHDNRKQSVGCNSCAKTQQDLCNADGCIEDALNDKNEASGESKIAMDKATKEVDEFKQSEEDLAKLQAVVEKHLETQQKLITKQAEQAMKLIHKESQRMIVNLQENVLARVDAIKQERQDLKTQILKFEKSFDSTTSVESTCKNESSGLTTVQEEKQTNNTILENKSYILGLAKFAQGTFDMSGTFGSVLQIQELKCDLVYEFGSFQLAGYVTTTSSGLLVVSDCNANEVLMYNRHNTGQYENKPCLCLTTKGTASPDGVAVSAEGKYLVARFRNVDVYSQSGNYEGALNFRHDNGPGNENKYATAIEVMHDGKIIVGDSYNSTLTIISKDHTVLRTIHTSTKPVRIASRLNGIIASYWKENKICLIDIESGLKVQTFDIPHSSAVCYHRQSDSLLVGRCLDMAANTMPKIGSGIIEQYCASTGKFVGRIAEGLFLPRDFTFTTDGLLAVADTKTVKLFRVE